jgi:hypothetical protein
VKGLAPTVRLSLAGEEAVAKRSLEQPGPQGALKIDIY